MVELLRQEDSLVEAQWLQIEGGGRQHPRLVEPFRCASLVESTETSMGREPSLGGAMLGLFWASSLSLRQLLDLLEFFNAFSWPARLPRSRKKKSLRLSVKMPL